jgi:predicted ribosome quality control (RQC) complex YloA/Tae2 family protein
MKTEHFYLEDSDVPITYLIGQNAKDNFAVIDQASPNDVWFHVKRESSCHVVVLLGHITIKNKEDEKEIIKHGAFLCKQNTSKLADGKKIDIIYTEIKNIRKTKTPGLVTTQNTQTISV